MRGVEQSEKRKIQSKVHRFREEHNTRSVRRTSTSPASAQLGDMPHSFAFCAYHNSVDFKEIGHVLYSVEPYQNVGGCSVRPGTPNGQLIDSTNNSLSHETTETITDPDGTAWINSTLVVLNGAEIGDECSFFIFIGPNPYFDPSNVILNDTPYAIPPEYDNSRHACTTGP